VWYVCIRRHSEPDVIGKALGPYQSQDAAEQAAERALDFTHTPLFFLTVDENPQLVGVVVREV
jgi:hypothetical protein